MPVNLPVNHQSMESPKRKPKPKLKPKAVGKAVPKQLLKDEQLISEMLPGIVTHLAKDPQEMHALMQSSQQQQNLIHDMKDPVKPSTWKAYLYSKLKSVWNLRAIQWLVNRPWCLTCISLTLSWLRNQVCRWLPYHYTITKKRYLAIRQALLGLLNSIAIDRLVSYLQAHGGPALVVQAGSIVVGFLLGNVITYLINRSTARSDLAQGQAWKSTLLYRFLKSTQRGCLAASDKLNP